MKTKEELDNLRDEVMRSDKKFAELSSEEMARISGGGGYDDWRPSCFYASAPCHYQTCPYHGICDNYSKY